MMTQKLMVCGTTAVTQEFLSDFREEFGVTNLLSTNEEEFALYVEFQTERPIDSAAVNELWRDGITGLTVI